MHALDGFMGSEDEGEEERVAPPAQRRPVANARLPADAGLSVLGLLMQVGGGALMLMAISAGIVGMIAMRSPMVLGLLFLCAGRSALQARAGAALAVGGVHGGRRLRVYIVGAVVQTGVVSGWVAWGFDEVPGSAVAFGAALLLAWPGVLVALQRRGDFRAALAAAGDAEADRLLPEDRGMTAVGLLMVAGGAVVLPVLGAALVSLGYGLAVGGFAVLVMMGVVALFAARAVLGARAGWVAMRSRDPRRFHAAFERYLLVAKLSTVGAGLYLLVASLFAGGAGLLGFLMLLPAFLALHAWPWALTRYVARNLPEGADEGMGTGMVTDERLPLLRRPRDAGLTGLGVVLLASGTVGVVGGLMVLGVSEEMVPESMAAAWAEADPLDLLLSLAGVMAGWCLLSMTRFFRVAAVVYGLVGGGMAVWGAIESLGTLEEAAMGSQWMLLVVMQVWVALVLPLLTLGVALRHEEVGDEVADQELVTAFD